jgi:hypothetical protein
MTRMRAFALLLLLAGVVAQAAPVRSRAVVRAFIAQSDHPQGWPGHVVDHRIPLCAGGPDRVTNMQWQERQASYQKDVFERALCMALTEQGYVLVKRPAVLSK